MLTATEIRKKYLSTLSRGGYVAPNSPYSCDNCHKRLAKVGTKKLYTYGYQTQYCSICIVKVVKKDLREKQRKKQKRKSPMRKRNSIKKRVSPQFKKVRKAIKKRL
jgi:hypothetical protein